MKQEQNSANKLKVFIIIFIVLVIITAYLLWPRNKPKSENKEEANNAGGGAAGSAASSLTDKNIFPIVNGVRGEHVLQLQKAINFSNKYYNYSTRIAEDGITGAKTIAALSQYYNDPAITTKNRWQIIVDNYNKGIPIGLVYVDDNTFPLFMGMVDRGASRRIRNLNIAFGVFPYNTTDPKANEFGWKLNDAIKLKYNGATSITKKQYIDIMAAASMAPTIFIN